MPGSLQAVASEPEGQTHTNTRVNTHAQALSVIYMKLHMLLTAVNQNLGGSAQCKHTVVRLLHFTSIHYLKINICINKCLESCIGECLIEVKTFQLK